MNAAYAHLCSHSALAKLLEASSARNHGEVGLALQKWCICLSLVAPSQRLGWVALVEVIQGVGETRQHDSTELKGGRLEAVEAPPHNDHGKHERCLNETEDSGGCRDCCFQVV